MIKQIIISVILTFSVLFVQGQIGKAKVVEKEGKEFYEHKVKKGQTAYGISQMYETSVDVLFKNNPDAANGLDIGEMLYIPVKKDQAEALPSDQTDAQAGNPEELQQEIHPDTNQIIHTVAAGETMYGIAKKYGVTVEDLKAANNNTFNLSIGQKIVIPVDKADKNNEDQPLIKNPINTSVAPGDSVILHKVKKGDTFYSLSNFYGVSGQDIRDANDGLPKGLQLGETIRIVVKKNAFIFFIAFPSIPLTSAMPGPLYLRPRRLSPAPMPQRLYALPEIVTTQ